MVEYFYSENVLLASTGAARLQRVFHVLEEIFNWVGLCTNIVKTVSIILHPCCVVWENLT